MKYSSSASIKIANIHGDIAIVCLGGMFCWKCVTIIGKRAALCINL